MVLEYGGNNWNQQAAAITPEGYVAAFAEIAKERERREKMIRAEDCQEADRLKNPPPYLVVVIEEAENVYAAVKSLGQSYKHLYADTMRDLVAMGRKQRILILVATTTGDGRGVRRAGAPQPGEQDAVQVGAGNRVSVQACPEEINLSRLPTGTCYSVGDGSLVEFPRIERPKLPASSLYHEARPEQLRRRAGAAPADGRHPQCD